MRDITLRGGLFPADMPLSRVQPHSLDDEGVDMSMLRKLPHRSKISPSRTRRELARALASAPTMATREELYVLQNR